MAKTITDPLRARLLELLQDVDDHSAQLRDFASVPGNAWLARGEHQQIMAILTEIESLLDDIKAQDAEDGY